MVYQMIDENGKIIKEMIKNPQQQRPNKVPNYKVTLRDDLGLHQMLNNFDKVKEKMIKGQKEVYKDGWSIRKL